MKWLLAIGVTLLSVLALSPRTATADIPRLINYQGKLAEPDGTPLVGDHTVTLRLYDDSVGGRVLWKEVHPIHFDRDDRGFFSVTLGSLLPFPNALDFNQPLWLTTDVDSSGELQPRQRLTAVSYAFNTDMVGGVPAGELLKVTDVSDEPPVDAQRIGVSGISSKVSRADHAHRGVRSLAIRGAEGLTEDVLLAAGPNIRLSQQDNTITVSAAGADGGHVTSVIAGDGLVGGGSEGEVAIHVAGGTGLVVGSDNVRVDAGTGAHQIVQLDDQARLPDVDGSQLTGLSADALGSGTVSNERLSAEVSRLGPSIESSEITDGAVAAGDTTDTFLTAGVGVELTKTPTSWEISAVGAGGDITSVVAGQGLTGGGTSGQVTLDIGVGTGLLASPDAINVDVGTTAHQLVQLDEHGALPPVSGEPLTALNAAALSAGTVPDGRLPATVSRLGPSIGTDEVDPGAITEPLLAEQSVGAAALSSTAIQPGDIQAGDLPAHASLHQPGGSDALPTASAVAVGSINGAGTSLSLARADHRHQGVHSIGVADQPAIVGDATLQAGANVTLLQEGQTITITGKGAGAPGSRVSVSASDAVALSTGADTELIAATITKSQTTSAVLILATVQLNHTGAPNDRLIDLKLFRDGTQLDQAYQVRVGRANQAVSEIPVTVQAWDTAGKGALTYALRAAASDGGAQATVRRLTLIELF